MVKLNAIHITYNKNDIFYVFPFIDSKYCVSILSPTKHTLKKSLESTFLNSNSSVQFHETNRIDLCCRYLYKCDAQKHSEFNQTIEWEFWNCACVRLFQICLQNVNTTLSNELAFVHAINSTKCVSKDHPIVKCVKFEEYAEITRKLPISVSLIEHEKYFKRCVKYELNQSIGRVLQTFDVPFNAIDFSTGTLSSMKIIYVLYTHKDAMTVDSRIRAVLKHRTTN